MLDQIPKMTYYGDNSPQLAASVIALTVIAFIPFGLRVYTRLNNQAWGLDDWAMTIATVYSLRWTHCRAVRLTIEDRYHLQD